MGHTCCFCGAIVETLYELVNNHDCVTYLKEVNAKLLDAIRLAHAELDAYYDQESFEETHLFKASEILAAAIKEGE